MKLATQSIVARTCITSIGTILIVGCSTPTATVVKHYPPLRAGSTVTISRYDPTGKTPPADRERIADAAAVGTLNALIEKPATPWATSFVTYVPATLIDAGPTGINFTDGFVVLNSRDPNHPAPQYDRRLGPEESAAVADLLRRWEAKPPAQQVAD